MDARVTFGFIVLNGKPFIIPNIAYLYPFAHEIIVAEGACEAGKAVAREDGHSTDGTYEALLEFKQQSDPENKLRIVTAAEAGFESGFWPDKNAMSRAYADNAAGDFVWQIDADEFYLEEDLAKVISLLGEDRYDTVSFETKTFFGSLDYELDGFYMRRDRGNIDHRIFRWGPGYQYKTHWPPTIINEAGVDLRTLRWLKPAASARMGIFMYHYCYLFTQQVSSKMAYYDGVRDLRSGASDKSREYGTYASLFSGAGTSPFKVSSVPDHLSWVRRYRGKHPKAVLGMVDNIKDSPDQARFRDNSDVESWLRSPGYIIACMLLELFARMQCHEPFRTAYKAWFKLARIFCRTQNNK